MAAAAHKIISQRYPELVNKPDDYTIEQVRLQRRSVCSLRISAAVSCWGGCCCPCPSALLPSIQLNPGCLQTWRADRVIAAMSSHSAMATAETHENAHDGC
jgi:hypothetical protein